MLVLLTLPVLNLCFRCRCAVKGTRKPAASPSDTCSTHSVLKQCKSFADLSRNHVFDILYHLGPHLHSDPVLLCQIVRVGRACFKEFLSGGMTGEASLPMNILQKVIDGRLFCHTSSSFLAKVWLVHLTKCACTQAKKLCTQIFAIFQ